MHPSLSAGGGGGGVDGWVELSTKYSGRRSLTGSQRKVAGKDRGNFFRERVSVFT